jgi:hypothetical protein
LERFADPGYFQKSLIILQDGFRTGEKDCNKSGTRLIDFPLFLGWGSFPGNFEQEITASECCIDPLFLLYC